MSYSILIVDDDVAFSRIIQNSLQTEGYQVLHASRSQQAKNILSTSASNISVMLLDWALPDESGIDLLHEIKRDRQCEDIQVILHTIRNEAETIQSSIEAGAFFYLVKPVDRQLLHATVRAAHKDFLHRQALKKRLSEMRRPFRFLTSAKFRFQKMEEGDFLAVRIAQETQQPEKAIVISELFTNAIEHGNLGLTFDEKTRLLASNMWEQEIQRRLQKRENLHKYVHVEFTRMDQNIRLVIEDMGMGFDYEKYLHFDPSRQLHSHGRGIAIVNSFFPLRFVGPGNKVIVHLPARP